MHCMYPELAWGGPRKLLVQGSEISSFATWSGSEPSARCQKCAPRHLAGPGVGGEPFPSRSRSPLRDVASTALGRAWPATPLPGPNNGPALDRVLDLAAAPAGLRAVAGVVVGAR